MAIRATVSRFPIDPDAQDVSGVLWGITVTPFAAKDKNCNPPAYGSDCHLLPRCENCWAYFNNCCEIDQWAWNCPLCGTLNGLFSQAIAKYSVPESCAESASSFIDLELSGDGSAEDAQVRPVYVAAVDLSCELQRNSIAGEECDVGSFGSPASGSLFGLATFSHKIGLYDVQGPVPVVKNVLVPADPDSNLPLELEDVMILLQFLSPVDTCKDSIASARETLRPTTSWERTTAAGQALDGVLMGGRGFGVAMDALFNYLGSEYGSTFALGMSKYSLKCRLRIRTVQYTAACNMNELYDSVDPEVVLSLLVHKCPKLQPLPKLVFALLRNPLLLFHEEGVHPDYRIYLHCLFSALEPSSLHRAVYPVLTSYSALGTQAYPRHSLCRTALITSGSPIFFLDTFTTLIMFYSSNADPSLPFPPPHDCLLRTTINELKQDRSITPQLLFIKGGQDDASTFENYLIEEQDVNGRGLSSVTGFVSFHEEITQSVLEYTK